MSERDTPTTFPSELAATTRLAIPLAIAQAGNMLMGVVDTAVVSRFDAAHATGVSIGHAISMGCIVFGMGLSVALEPLMAQAQGANEPLRIWGWWKTGLRASLLASIPLALLALVLTSLCHLVGINEDTRDYAVDYVIGRTPGNLLLLVWMAARSFFQAHQYTRSLLAAVLVANILNFAMNVLVVDGVVQWGAAGSGWATSVATIGLVLYLLWETRRFKPADAEAAPQGDVALLFKLGLPLGLQMASEFLVFSTCGVIAATFGDIDGNAHQIALNCTAMTFMGALGVSGATGARVAQAVGLNRLDLVKLRARVGLFLTLALMGGSALMFAFIPETIIGLFAPKEPAVFTLSVQLLFIGALFQFVDGAQVLLAGALRGIGDIRFPFVVTVISYWGIGFSSALYFSFELEMGLHGLWWGLSVGLAAASIGLGWRYLYVEKRGVTRLENPPIH